MLRGDDLDRLGPERAMYGASCVSRALFLRSIASRHNELHVQALPWH